MDGGDEGAQLVHVHGGSVLLDLLPAAGILGERLHWCDPVASGPTPGNVEADDWYRLRAEHLQAALRADDAAVIEARLRAQDQALRNLSAQAEIVIWAGPEMYCQLILVRLLVLLEERGQRGQLSLVDPGNPFGTRGCGLEKLSAPALREAFAGRRLVDANMLALAKTAWAAFTAPTPAQLVALVSHPTPALPHLGAALKRHLDDLPDAATGLSSTETHLLEALASGTRERRSLLDALAAREKRPFLTEMMLNVVLSRLGEGPRPLLTAAEEVAITKRGRDVLSGYEMWHCERWHGGIFIGAEQNEATLPSHENTQTQACELSQLSRLN